MIHKFLITVTLIIILSGCGSDSSESNFIVGPINGPSDVDVNVATEFSVSVSGGTGITYAWTVEPVSAGTFSSTNTATTSFKAASVTSETEISIIVVVTSNDRGPEVRLMDIMVKPVPDGWAVSWGGSGTDIGTDFTVDNDGNIYIVGRAGPDTDFDPGTGSSINDGDPIFLSRITSFGNFEWAVTWDAISAIGVAANSQGMIAVSGDYQGAPDLDPEADEFIVASENPGCYLSVFDSFSNFQWCSVSQGSNDYVDTGFQESWFDYSNWAFDVASDNNGNWLILKRHHLDLTWGPNIKYHTPGGSSTDDYIHLLRYDSTGAWDGESYRFAEVSLNRVASAGSSGYYLAGHDNGQPYIAKLRDDLSGHWSRVDEGETGDNLDIATDSFGNVVTVGTVSQGGDKNCKLKLYDPNANTLLELTWGSSSDDAATGVAVGHNGEFYVTGYFTGTTDFDPGPAVNEVSFDAHHGYFLLSLDSEGDFVWVRTWGGSYYQEIFNPKVAVSGFGDIYVMGSFTGTADIDIGPGVQDVESAGQSDVYLIKVAV